MDRRALKTSDDEDSILVLSPLRTVVTAIEGYIRSDRYLVYLEESACEHKNRYRLLFVLEAIILVFSLYLNVFFQYKPSLMPWGLQ